MPAVVIAPSYGSKESRTHWASTLAEPVSFTELAVDNLLTESQKADLSLLHPEGKARFWGAQPAHDKKMEHVKTGDVVLFTGEKIVRAIGEIGHIFRNRGFADHLWPPHAEGTSWHTVYSLVGFERTEIPYPDLCRVLDYNEKHTFPGQIVVRAEDPKARRVLDEFLIETRSEQLIVELAPNLHGPGTTRGQATRLLPGERHLVPHARYSQAAGFRVAERKESALLGAYRAFIDVGTGHRYSCRAGITDLYVVHTDGSEIIEAKGESGPKWVRQALSQLLDYAPYSPEPARRLTALFPDRPASADVEYLHRYGIDCVYRTATGTFDRIPAQESVRTEMRRRWSE
ncbi:hypothetical protein ACIBSV_04095 [Embleya sp. NPDC050154]|uniref:hypothetical protein n=1 Tax=Embleya sp. NPDC050154 TaxID=3363988 RepID=UPI0037B64358